MNCPYEKYAHRIKQLYKKKSYKNLSYLLLSSRPSTAKRGGNSITRSQDGIGFVSTLPPSPKSADKLPTWLPPAPRAKRSALFVFIYYNYNFVNLKTYYATRAEQQSQKFGPIKTSPSALNVPLFVYYLLVCQPNNYNQNILKQLVCTPNK